MSGYLQLSFDTDREQAQIATDLLEMSGALSVTIESADDEACFDAADPGEPRWAWQSVKALYLEDTDLETIVAQVQRDIVTTASPAVTVIDDQDWERAWLEQFQPQKISAGLWVCPSWCEPPEPEQINLMIDPGLAFGTGTHETTRLCLGWLSELPLQGMEVIDYGCGSGILAIAALKLGATAAVGVDVDDRAVATALANAAANGVQGRFSACGSEDFADRKADLVCANILAGTLLELAPRLTRMTREGGMLMLSGILEDQESMVRTAYEDDFDLVTRQCGQWLMLAGKKRPTQ